ncbi:hypothetical protein G6L28_07630 [Agrobacterium larrymoorei]|uniref:hypothetical protein n=1 Tax=Agrobacterium larrymoorei TaxID=160699 RepID=UPI001572FD8A|nr:hypothetical protein [Agrobacterium larrymoorei]NTJ42469.1 hypothetical protein [Agrobacterium larrymoorei]
MKSQSSSDSRRVLEAANSASSSTYKPLIIPLRGTYVAMIFRRTCRGALSTQKN